MDLYDIRASSDSLRAYLQKYCPFFTQLSSSDELRAQLFFHAFGSLITRDQAVTTQDQVYLKAAEPTYTEIVQRTIYASYLRSARDLGILTDSVAAPNPSSSTPTHAPTKGRDQHQRYALL